MAKKKTSSISMATATEMRPQTFEELLKLLGASRGYQLMVLTCLTLAKSFPGMVTLSHSFAKPSLMEYTCDINATLGGDRQSLCSSVEATQDQCRVRLNCSSGTGDGTTTFTEEPCQDWHFNRSVFTETVASRFRLVCSDSHLADLAATGYFAGFLIGASLYGVLADRYGRLPASLIGMVNLTLMTALAALAPAYWLYAVAMVLAGIGNGGLVTVLYTASIESTDAPHRLVWGFTFNQGWTIGILIVTLVAYLERNYQAQLLWLCAASLPLYALVLLSGESARWLVSTGRVERANSVIARMARINRSTDKLPKDFSAAELIHHPSATEEDKAKADERRKGGLVDLFRTPGLRRATLLSWLHWFAASMTYYGISLGADAIGGNIFVNMALVSAVEIPARFLGMSLSICNVGRKPVLYVSFALSAAFLAAMAAVYDLSATGSAAANVALAVMSKLCITIAFDGVWLYYSELFPTVIRSLGVGSGSTLARVGAMLSTQLLPLRSVWGPLPFVIFGVGPLLACLIIYFLPETVGKALPETVADGERFVLSGGGRLCGSKVGATVDAGDKEVGNSMELDKRNAQ